MELTYEWQKIATISQLYLAANGWQSYTYQYLWAKINNQNIEKNTTVVDFKMTQKIDKLSFFNKNYQEYKMITDGPNDSNPSFSGQMNQNNINTTEKIVWENQSLEFKHYDDGSCNFDFTYSGPISSSGTSNPITKTVTGNCIIPSIIKAPTIKSFFVKLQSSNQVTGAYEYSGEANQAILYINNQGQALNKPQENIINNFTVSISDSEELNIYLKLLKDNIVFTKSEIQTIQLNDYILPAPIIEGIDSDSSDEFFYLNNEYECTFTTTDDKPFKSVSLIGKIDDKEISLGLYTPQKENDKYKINFYIFDLNAYPTDEIQFKIALLSDLDILGKYSNYSDSIEVLASTQGGNIYISKQESNKREEDWDDNNKI